MGNKLGWNFNVQIRLQTANQVPSITAWAFFIISSRISFETKTIRNHFPTENVYKSLRLSLVWCLSCIKILQETLFDSQICCFSSPSSAGKRTKEIFFGIFTSHLRKDRSRSLKKICVGGLFTNIIYKGRQEFLYTRNSKVYFFSLKIFFIMKWVLVVKSKRKKFFLSLFSVIVT